jgi:hypothetical protein
VGRTSELRAENQQQQEQARQTRERERDLAKLAKLNADADALVESIRTHGPAADRELRARLGYGADRTRTAIDKALGERRICVIQIERQCGPGVRKVNGYGLETPSEETSSLHRSAPVCTGPNTGLDRCAGNTGTPVRVGGGTPIGGSPHQTGVTGAGMGILNDTGPGYTGPGDPDRTGVRPPAEAEADSPVTLAITGSPGRDPTASPLLSAGAGRPAVAFGRDRAGPDGLGRYHPSPAAVVV